MKILHCADVHLDSPMNTILPPEQAKERRLELVKAFQRMAEFAARQGVSAVIIAGDLFDVSRISAGTRSSVLSTIRRHRDMRWYYLKGNHDRNDFLGASDEVPDNLFLFSDVWKSYRLSERICLSGVELGRENAASVWTSLRLDPDDFNIVTLHGQESLSSGKNDAELIDLRALRNRGIDYLALGHIHSYKYEALDGRGYYCYPGCLEARGYDETGAHGFVILDVNEETGRFSSDLYSMPIRSVYSVDVDISGCRGSSEILGTVLPALRAAGCTAEDLVEVVLTGEQDLDSERDVPLLQMQLSDRYYAFRIRDAVRLKLDLEKYRNDRSLKGEFVRTVEAREGLSDADKARIIRIGIRALQGEETSL